jgi:hypothetical protein
MIIKSVIRGGYRSAAEYMKEQGKNEKTRLVELSDPSANTLDDAFHNMWVVAANTKCTKPLHHISINPALGERLTDAQLMKIAEHCEKIYGYQMFQHQRVIVEHIKEGRQHFHVIWNRVGLVTGRPVWPGLHWKKSKQICREMEKELGLKSPTPRNRNKTPRGNRSASKKWGKTKSGFNGNVKWRKPKTSGAGFKSSSVNHGHGPSSQQPVMQPKIILFSPSPPSAQQSGFFQPHRPRGGWPPAAVLDWGSWGHKNPRRFFALWPELSG